MQRITSKSVFVFCWKKKGWNIKEENKGIREISDQDSTGIRCTCLWK